MIVSTSDTRQGHVKGFTLIELLVVIAIIGILSSVVLGSLALARLKGADANVKANLHTIQSQMELYYDNNGQKYHNASPVYLGCQPSASNVIGSTGAFGTDPQVKNALVGAITNGGPGYWTVGKNSASYAVAIPLRADSSYWWCIDSSGVAKKEASTLFGSCPLGGGNSNAAACP